MTTIFLDNEVTGTFTAPSESQEFTVANKKDFGDKRLDLVGTFSAAGTFDGGTLLLQGYDGAAWNDIATLTAAGAVRVGPASALTYRAVMSGGTSPDVTWWVNSELWFEGSGPTPPPPSNINKWDNHSTAVVLSNGALTATFPITQPGYGQAGVMAQLGASEGKYYWEVRCDSAHTGIGVAYAIWASSLNNNGTFANSNLFSYYSFSGLLMAGGLPYGDPYGPGDVVGVALDLDNHRVWFSKNGVWQASGDPAAGTNPAYSSMPPNSGLYYPACALESTDSTLAQCTANFGGSAFTYPVPSGFMPGAPQ